MYPISLILIQFFSILWDLKLKAILITEPQKSLYFGLKCKILKFPNKNHLLIYYNRKELLEYDCSIKTLQINSDLMFLIKICPPRSQLVSKKVTPFTVFSAYLGILRISYIIFPNIPSIL